MPKAEKGTPKEIANRCKSKGLQKLRWYCEMCQKQCRDQNGFKCHLMSESHQRQLLLFAENQKAYLSQFSREFEANFMHILRHTFGTKRVRANEVYQEYIKDKKHIHMNSTVWHTLTGFVLYLGESGKCKIDENEKGWHIKYIDQEEELRKQKVLKKAKSEKDDEDKMNELLQRRIDKALENQKDDQDNDEPKELVRKEGETIKFSLSTNLVKPTVLKTSAFNPLKPSLLNPLKPSSLNPLKTLPLQQKKIKKEASSSKEKERYKNYHYKRSDSFSSNEDYDRKKIFKKERRSISRESNKEYDRRKVIKKERRSWSKESNKEYDRRKVIKKERRSSSNDSNKDYKKKKV